jgi:hypothetical protein
MAIIAGGRCSRRTVQRWWVKAFECMLVQPWIQHVLLWLFIVVVQPAAAAPCSAVGAAKTEYSSHMACVP